MAGAGRTWGYLLLLVVPLVAILPIKSTACDHTVRGCAIGSDTLDPTPCLGCDWNTAPVSVYVGTTLAATLHVTHSHNTFGLAGTAPPTLTVQVTPQNNHRVTQLLFDGQSYMDPNPGLPFTKNFNVFESPPVQPRDAAAAVVANDQQYGSDTCVVASPAVSKPFCVGARMKGQAMPKLLKVEVAPPTGAPVTSDHWVAFFKQTQRTELEALFPWDQYVALDRLGYWDDPNGFLDASDVAFLDMDGSGSVTVNDVRLTAGAQTSKVSVEDKEVTYVLQPGALGVFCYLDDNGSLTFDANEPVYYAQACATVAANDVRIANAPTGGKGSQVRTSDNDAGDKLQPFPAAKLAYLDADGDMALSVGDMAILDQDGSGTVSLLDVALSGTQAGVVVANGAFPDFNNALRALALHDAFFDADADQAYSRGDTVYLDDDASGFGSVMDLRLSGVNSFGTFVAAPDEDARYVLRGGGPGFVCYVDDDGGLDFDADESVYYAAGCSAVQPNDVRVANPVAGKALGSKARGTDNDDSNALRAFPAGAAFGYHDRDGDRHFGTGDTLFWDSDGSATVTVNDIILSGIKAGGLQKAADPLSNNVLVTLAVTPRFFDVDGAGGYSSDDSVYLDTDGSATGTVADVRVSPLPPASFGSLVAPKDTDATYDLLPATHATACKSSNSGSAIVYLQRQPCGTSASNDVRLQRQGTFTDGSLATASGAEATVFQPLVVCTLDDNGDGRYSGVDRVYLNLGATCDGLDPNNDLLFRSSPAAVPSTTSTTTPPSTSSTSSTSTTTTSTTITSSGGTSTSNTTPGPAALVVILALGFLVRLRRRLPS